MSCVSEVPAPQQHLHVQKDSPVEMPLQAAAPILLRLEQNFVLHTRGSLISSLEVLRRLSIQTKLLLVKPHKQVTKAGNLAPDYIRDMQGKPNLHRESALLLIGIFQSSGLLTSKT
jgi:hypothetical protein